jgi:hypothetical protein
MRVLLFHITFYSFSLLFSSYNSCILLYFLFLFSCSIINMPLSDKRKASQRAYRLKKTAERKAFEKDHPQSRRDRINVETVKRYKRGFKNRVHKTSRRNKLYLYPIKWDGSNNNNNKRKIPVVHKY